MASSVPWRSTLDPARIMQIDVTHWQVQEHYRRTEQLAVEEPLEIRIEHRSLAVIMRTPGNDFELAWGFLFSEGLIQHANAVLTLECAHDSDGLPLPNVINVTLHPTEPLASSHVAYPPSASFARHFTVSSSCGLCGKDSIEQAMRTALPLEPDAISIKAAVLYKLTQCLREQQTVFSYTGGLHAAGLFSLAGELLLLREDVGRHNALDKLIGYGLMHDKIGQGYGLYPYREHILLVSGRTSFEIVQKALHARIPCVAAISAPSSLAVELAERGGITLIGFLRDTGMNVYTHPERIV